MTNLAARLCGEAKGGQILVSSRVVGAVEELIETEEVGSLALKGLLKPVPTFNVGRLKATARESPWARGRALLRARHLYAGYALG